ncbi:MAG: HPt (histidine-containing phosphotransfer) domain-containing protein [Rhodothermales bacterium]|jgi:HPt (histidine-containing phosphotransfer) domain-containing protein
MRSAIDKEDMDKIAFAAHALKSSSASLGIHKMAHTCYELELRHFEKDFLSIPKLVSRLVEEFTLVVPILQDYQKSHQE